MALISASCDEDRAQVRLGNDDRWKKWAKKGAEPSMDTRLRGQSTFGLVFAVTDDRGNAIFADMQAGLVGKPKISLIDLGTGKLIRSFPAPSIQCVAFARGGETAISGGGDGRIRVWRLADGNEIAHAAAHKGFVRAVACSPAEDRAVTGGEDGELVIWDLDELKVARRLSGHTAPIRHNCLTWSADGKRILSGSWDGSVRLWEAATGDELATLNPGFGRVMSIALSPDGKRALSSYLDGPDNPVLLWDLDTQRELHRFGIPGNPWFANRELHVASVAFSSTGETALFGMVFGSVILWNVTEWKELVHNRVHDEELAFVAYSADGNSSVSVGCDRDTVKEDARVRIWKLPKPNGCESDGRPDRDPNQTPKAEQGGAGQPATAEESKSEGKRQSETESEVRPQ